MDSSKVLDLFKEITKIPRESGHEELMASYLIDFALNHGLEHKKDKAGNVTELPCDSVIVSTGYIPTPLAKESVKVHLVGDCLSIGNLRSVIWRAYEVAMKI